MRESLIGRLAVAGAVVFALVAVLVPAVGTGAALAATCNLGPGGSIHHVIYVQYDNTHLLRDNPNVPSDLEQVPALKGFLTGNGTLLSNDHTILISHTAGGIVSALTGLYPDRNGIAVANSYGVFKPDGSIDTPSAPAFTYWTDQTTTLDPFPNLITDNQKNTPAPWVPYTRAGCDVGAFSIANMELENTSTTPSGDITKVFGSGSPEFNFAKSAAPSAEKTADFEGIAVHCSQADSLAGGLCASGNGGKPDVLPDEPGGYSGFNALFGAPYANQVVDQPGGFQASTADANGTAAGYNDLAPAVDDVFDFSHTPGAVPCSVAPDPGPCPATKPIGNGAVNGFPGFSPTAAQTLGYTAAMQESGIPITFAYIEDSHDDQEAGVGACPASGITNGPGSACYEQQLKDQNTAYEAFFNRLAADGINKSNTMFVFTVDEGDHFVGGPATNAATCDGVTVPCTYATGITGPGSVGEIDTNLNQLVTSEDPTDTTPFDIHFDDAPTVYVPNAPNGPPGPTNTAVRQLERDMGNLTITNPRTGNVDRVTQHIADQETQSILHEVNTDPLRTPSFTLFGNDDYFFQSSCPSGSTPSQPGCPAVGNGFAWNHGDDNPVISDTWIGMVGPNVNNLGQTGGIWTDHTDLRPTMLAALGLSDDYASDGDVISQVIAPSSLPATLDAHLTSYQGLEAVRKQLDAPFGEFGHDAEIVSTTAVATTSPAAYDLWDAQLADCKAVRDGMDAQIQSLLTGASAGTTTLDDAAADGLAKQGNALIAAMDTLAGQTTPPNAAACDIAPSASTGPAGSITTSGASLTGTVNPSGTATNYTFEYGPTQSFGSITPVAAAGSGTTAATESAAVSGLAPNTTYYYRLVATNNTGTTFGGVKAFTTTGTPQAPVVLTGTASSVADTSATVTGQVDPAGQATAFTFEYGPSTSFGSTSPVVGLDNANSAEPVSADLTGLSPDTTYDYRAVAANSTGTTFGAVMSFTTGPGTAPVVVTGPVTGVAGTGATLTGTVDPRGLQTSFAFEYGTTPAFGSLTAVDNAGSAGGPQPVSLPVGGLDRNTTYVYRIVATNADGTTVGSVGTFTTGLGT